MKEEEAYTRCKMRAHFGGRVFTARAENEARVSDAFEIKLRGPYGVSGARPDDVLRGKETNRGDRRHKDPLSFCFRPHENRKRGETTKSRSQLLRR